MGEHRCDAEFRCEECGHYFVDCSEDDEGAGMAQCPECEGDAVEVAAQEPGQ